MKGWENMAFYCFHVSAQHEPEEGRQEPSLLQRSGKPARLGRQDSAAYGAVPGRDQRFSADGMAQDAGSIRRRATTDTQPEFVSRRQRSAGRDARQFAGESGWTGVATPAPVRQLLAGKRTLAATGFNGVLAGAIT